MCFCAAPWFQFHSKFSSNLLYFLINSLFYPKLPQPFKCISEVCSYSFLDLDYEVESEIYAFIVKDRRSSIGEYLQKQDRRHVIVYYLDFRAFYLIFSPFRLWSEWLGWILRFDFFHVSESNWVEGSTIDGPRSFCVYFCFMTRGSFIKGYSQRHWHRD